MLEVLPLKFHLIGSVKGGSKASVRSPFRSRTGTRVAKSVASCSVSSIPTITESPQGEQVAMSSQQTRSSRPADKALSHILVACGKTGIDNLKALKSWFVEK